MAESPASIDQPIVDDKVYGSNADEGLQLLACTLEFTSLLAGSS
ncbi:MAG TPA: hypothetical protein VN030_04480 [Cellvibrio sp.]|nr:hypothetical protein [Cellvibrio sp.]